jgi:hypothetical protein
MVVADAAKAREENAPNRAMAGKPLREFDGIVLRTLDAQR